MDGIDYRRLLAQLKRDEGAKRDKDGHHVAYRCSSDKLTIGYGHNLEANPIPGVYADSKLNDDQAERLLIHDVEKVRERLQRALPWTSDLEPARYAVLVNMAFNMGVDGLLQFKPTLELIRVGDYHNAAGRMMRSKWASQVGGRAERLAKQMETGGWQ